jgi:hypothetical protein
VDLCLRVGEAGYRVLYCAHSRLVHHESFTRGVTTRGDPHPADSSLFRSKWAGILVGGDPYYHPGISPTSTKWEIRLPLPFNLDVRRRVWTREAGKRRERVTITRPQQAPASR